MKQENRQDGRLDAVEPRVKAETYTDPFGAFEAVVSQAAYPRGHRRVVRQDRAAVPGSAQILRGIERKRRCMAETAERAQSAGKKMTDNTVGMFDQWSDIYNQFFRFDGTRRLAEVYIETSEKIAHETLDLSRKYFELSASGARKFWQVADEQLREGQQNR